MASEVVEPVNVSDRPWGGSCHNLLNVAGIWMTSMARENVPEKLRLHLEELALLNVEDHVRFSQSKQDLANMTDVLMEVLREDKDIVHIDNDKFVDELKEKLVHEFLKSTGTI